MATLGIGTWNFKDSLADAELLEWWIWAVDEVIPLIEVSSGTNSIKITRRSSI
tara:strand:- start:47 stop:205 length:159 start_codon:yes stop_codon:yes gene_type:complete